jgi:hypothetical protein
LGVTNQQLCNFLSERGIDRDVVMVRDARYVFPAKWWLFGKFADDLGEMRLQFGLEKWRPEDGDCDDFAELACFYARFLHRRTWNPGEERAAIAFGEFDYCREGLVQNGHAINCAIVFENGAPRLVFMEPQSGKEVDLSQEEICSCFGVLF